MKKNYIDIRLKTTRTFKHYKVFTRLQNIYKLFGKLLAIN